MIMANSSIWARPTIAVAFAAAVGVHGSAVNARDAEATQPPVVFSIVNVGEISEPDVFYGQYVPGHLQLVRDFEGSFIVATPEHQSIEGARGVGVKVIHQWPSRDDFHLWFGSEDCSPWRDLLHSVSVADVILVDALTDAVKVRCGMP